MKDELDFISSKRFEISYVEEVDAASAFSEYNKRWSFSYVYHLTEVRDIYLALKKAAIPKGTRNFKKEFTRFCKSIDLPYCKTEWNERRILEYLNALENFSILNNDFSIKKSIFQNGRIGEPLRQRDLNDLRRIYFGYFRFKELLSWLITPPEFARIETIKSVNKSAITSRSKPIFFFSERGRFTDNFFYKLESNSPLYKIPETNGELARFWDVFISWGRALGVLEKFSFKYPSILTNTSKLVGCCYAVSNKRSLKSLPELLNENYSTRFIYLPDLVLDLALQHRIRIENIKKFVIDEYVKNKNLYSIERTSEIFIARRKLKEGDIILFPKYKDSYVSHLIVRR